MPQQVLQVLETVMMEMGMGHAEMLAESGALLGQRRLVLAQ
jgi:hypothetical protein